MAKLHIVCFLMKTSDWRLECFAVASGMIYSTCYIRKDIAGEFYITEYTDDNNLSIKNK